MRVTNIHSATVTPPGGSVIAPGGVGEADGSHPVVKAWIAAGLLKAEQPAPAPEPVEAPAKGRGK